MTRNVTEKTINPNKMLVEARVPQGTELLWICSRRRTVPIKRDLTESLRRCERE
jgi:hypothetical protein